MNRGYEASKTKLQAYCIAERHQRLERAAKWRQACYCGALIPYEKRDQKFCSHKCSAAQNNRTRIRWKMCRCGKRFHGPSKSCQTCTQPKDKPFDLLQTDYSRRQRLLKELGWMCQLCGITEWCGKSTPVVLDHIDGNADNNKRGNCRLICPNCDAQLPTFSGRNKGKGRSKRRNSVKHKLRV
jgi:hypothetical protein